MEALEGPEEDLRKACVSAFPVSDLLEWLPEPEVEGIVEHLG